MHDFKLYKRNRRDEYDKFRNGFIISQQEEIDVQVLNFIVNAEGKKLNRKRKRKKKNLGNVEFLMATKNDQ